MLKRNIAVVVLVGLVLAGGAAALAAGGPERPTVLAAAAQESPGTPETDPPPVDPPARLTDEQRQALRTCLQEADDGEARQACFAAAGLPEHPRPARRAHGPGPLADLTDEQRAALRTCLEQATEADARQACFAAAGVPEHAAGRGPRHKGPGPLGVLGRAVHGTVRVPTEDGGWQDVTFDRGKVAAATDGSKVVLERPDGQTVTLAVNGDTKFHGVAGAEELVDGGPAVVVSKDGTAVHVHQKG